MPRISQPFYASNAFPVQGVAERVQRDAAARIIPRLSSGHARSTVPRSSSTMEQYTRLLNQRMAAQNSYRVAFGSLPQNELVKRRLRDAGLGTLRLAIQIASDLEQRLMKAAVDEVNPGYRYIQQGRPASKRSARYAQPSTPQRKNGRREIPMIMQVRPNACGDACMQMVLAYFRKSHMRQGTNDRLFFRGLSPKDIEKALQEKELLATKLMPLKKKEWQLWEIKDHTRTFGPLIAVGQFHFVVIAGVEGNSVLINDPLLGRREMTIEQLNKWIFHDERCPVLGFSQPRPASGNVRRQAASPVQSFSSPAAPGVADQAMVSALRAIYKRLL